ncbi:MFS transporter [Pelagibacteraceae bacterium]|jgi:MFS family permease|nr:MFS transporter [Pelagibacteraceae bacterium]
MYNKNFIVICISSTIAAFPPMAVVLLGGIITSQIMMKDSLATVPMTLMIIGIAIGAPIASRFMSIWGRQKGFLFSSLLSCLALTLCSIAIFLENFYVFALGNFLIGSSQAFIHQYRFAASESVTKEFIPRSISIILLLGIVSALLSSNFAEYFKDFFPNNLFLGSYIFLSFTAIIPFFVLLFYEETKTSNNQSKFQIETIFKLLKNIKIIQSIVSAGLGYFTMAIIMTATPLHMHLVNKFTLFETSIVIQLHVIGMFLPSLFSGDLIKRFGNTNIIYAGVVILFLSILTNTFFEFYYSYMLGLILLGIGWNFLFVSGSSLLVVSYKEKDKFTAQGLNDFIVFSTQGIGSLSAGFLLYFSNWTVINLLCVPLLIIVLVVSFISSRNN